MIALLEPVGLLEPAASLVPAAPLVPLGPAVPVFLGPAVPVALEPVALAGPAAPPMPLEPAALPGPAAPLMPPLSLPAGGDSLARARSAAWCALQSAMTPRRNAVHSSTSTKDSKPGARLRFKSRLGARVKEVVENIVDSLGIKPGDSRAKLFEGMTEGDATRLWDLFNERGYKNPAIRKQAAEWAFSKNPRTASDLVAEIQFYDSEVTNRAAKLVADVKAEIAGEIAKDEATKGSKLSSAEISAVTRAVSTRRLGRALDKIGPAALDAAFTRTVADMAQTKVLADGTTTTIGAEATDAAWKTNLAAQTGPDSAGARGIRVRSDAELPAQIKSIADTLSFSNEADGAYHAHKHARELAVPTTPATEMAAYLKAARQFIHDKPGVTRQNQNGSRSVVFEADGMRAIVSISTEGNASISTFGKSN